LNLIFTSVRCLKKLAGLIVTQQKRIALSTRGHGWTWWWGERLGRAV